MSFTATVENGGIVFPPGVDLPNGTIVKIEPQVKQAPTLRDLLREFEGIADDLPSDMAANHNHYIHGQPKS